MSGRYQNILIDLSPKIMPGHLTRRSVCSCGHNQVADSVPLGREYQCDIKSVRWARLSCAGCGKVTDVRLCDVWSPLGATLVMSPDWFYFDALDLGGAFTGPPKPANWEPVTNNRVGPPVRLPRRGVM
jgi:hypothetical protein